MKQFARLSFVRYFVRYTKSVYCAPAAASEKETAVYITMYNRA